jgi:hypothetical protein
MKMKTVCLTHKKRHVASPAIHRVPVEFFRKIKTELSCRNNFQTLKHSHGDHGVPCVNHWQHRRSLPDLDCCHHPRILCPCGGHKRNDLLVLGGAQLKRGHSCCGPGLGVLGLVRIGTGQGGAIRGHPEGGGREGSTGDGDRDNQLVDN